MNEQKLSVTVNDVRFSVWYDRYVFDRNNYYWSIEDVSYSYFNEPILIAEGDDLKSGVCEYGDYTPLAEMMKSFLSFC